MNSKEQKKEGKMKKSGTKNKERREIGAS